MSPTDPAPTASPVPRRRRWKAVTLIAVVIGLATVAAVALYKALSPSPIPSNAVLKMKLSGELPERVAGDGVFALLGEPRLTLKDHLDNLKKAAADRRVKGVVLRLDGPELGWAKVEELRGAIHTFRASGKFIVAYAEQLSEPSYAVAAACDEVLMPPDAPFELNGLSAEVLHLPGLLEKLGIEVQYFRYGKYKSVSGEEMGRKALTEPVKEMIRDNLDGQYRRFVAMVASDRKLSDEKVRALVDTSGLRADWAGQNGLIDGLAYFDEVESKLRGRLGLAADAELPFVSGPRYRDESFSSAGVREGNDVVALVYSVGLIVAGKGGGGVLGDADQGTTPIISALRRAGKDDEVKAVVFRVDSPGGAGLGCDLVRREVQELAKKKPVVVSMSDAAASGGYWVAMDATAIVAQPSTLTGSIGIWAVVPNLKGAYDKLGVNPETFTRGAHADMLSGARPFTPEEAKLFDDELLASYRRFVELAAKGRGKSVEQMEEIAQGRTWSGERAKELGLVDALGGLDTAVELAARKAKLPEKAAVKVEQYEEERGLLRTVFGRDDDDDLEDEAPALTPLARKAAAATGVPAVLRKLGAPVWAAELLRGRERLYPAAEYQLRFK